MKKTTLITLLALIITACGGGSGSEESCLKQYWDGTVGVCLPRGWTVIDAETMRQRGVPEDTIAGFQSDDAYSGQFLTVTVTEEPLAVIVNPEDYSSANVRMMSTLPNYALIDSTNVNIDGSSIELHIFSAQPIADEPKRRFYQISTVVDQTGYSVTATSPVSVEQDIEAQLISILQSATFQAIKGEVDPKDDPEEEK